MSLSDPGQRALDEGAPNDPANSDSAPIDPDPTDPAPTDPAPTDPARAGRVADGKWLGGVCTGLAQHLGWPVSAIRLAFVILSAVQLVGVVIYAILWLVLPPARPPERAPGLESHSRTGLRPAARLRGRDLASLAAITSVAVGVVWLLQLLGWGIDGEYFWPLVIAASGIALIWRQADAVATPNKGPGLIRPRWPSIVRVGVGVGLVAVGFVLLISNELGSEDLPKIALIIVAGIAGLGVVVAPWWYRSRQALAEAREARILSDARADMAAHLHDSVLQTLALMQRQSYDPLAVQTLARRQERELRAWLYDEQVPQTTLKAALASAAAEIEDERKVPVEVISVGDRELDEASMVLVQAAREAVLNAAKHSGATKIDVYAEVSEDDISVFVRDRGRGFDLDAVAADRHGIRDSIIERMQRHGGTAVVRTAPGEGTEVRLEMTL